MGTIALPSLLKITITTSPASARFGLFGKTNSRLRIFYTDRTIQCMGGMRLNSRLSAVVVFLATFVLSGCLFRTRRVEQNLSPVALKSATKSELVAYIN